MDGETRTKHTDDDALSLALLEEKDRRTQNEEQRRTKNNEEQRRMKNNEERTKHFIHLQKGKKGRVPYPKKPHFIHLQKAKKRLPKETSQGRCCYYLLSIVIALCTPQLFVRQ